MLCLPVFMETKLVFKQENTLCVMHFNFLLLVFVFLFLVSCIRAIKLACSVVDGRPLSSRSARAHGVIVLHRHKHYQRSHSWYTFDHRQEKSFNKVAKERLRLTLHDVFIFERHTYTVVLNLLSLLILF